MEAPRTAAALTNRGIAAERAGNREEARRRFADALAIDPSYELGWLWYATVAKEPGERLYALNRALKLNPDSPATVGAASLAGIEPVVPEDLADLAKPGMPPGLAPRPGGIAARIRPGRPGHRVVSRPRRIDGDGRVRRGRRPAKAAAAAGDSARRMGRLGGLAALLLVLALAAGWYVWLRPQRDVIHVAFAGALSGPYAATGQEARDSALLYLDETNRAGGIDGRDVRLVAYDDQGDPDVARQRAEEIVADGRAVLVIGHDTSEASLAAGEVYEAAGIPAITGGATADEVTADRPWYFRTVFTNAGQGALMATYAARVLDHKTASVVYADDDYGRSLRDSFEERFRIEGGTIAQSWAIAEGDREATIQQVANDLAADPDAGIVVLATMDADARDSIVALRRANVDLPIFGADSLGVRGFGQMFADLPEELERPGSFTDGVYAVSPYMYGAGGGRAVEFLDRFRTAFGYAPDGWAVKTYDAALAAVYAIDRADVGGSADSLADDRQMVRDQLAALNSPAVAIPSVEGPLYFDEERSFPQEIWIGRFEGGSPVVAPTQYLPVVDARRYDVDEEIAQGRMSEIGGRYFSPTQVVYTGIDINEISSLDTAEETFVADFFVWFRYTGDEAVTNVLFANSVDPVLSLGDPVETGVSEGFTYAVFRVQGEFKEALNFIEYPWDQHDLSIRLQNAVLREDEVVYVVDQLALDQPPAERLRSGLDVTQSINGIPNWQATGVTFFQDTVSSDSALGDSRLSSAAGAVSYSQFVTDITIARDVRSFLLKNLLPLAMLALVTYISLWFPKENAGARTGFAITAILTSAVLLGGVSSQLPEIGYTVAIEWGFYAYIALAAVLVVLNMSIERLMKQKRVAAAHRLDVLGRIMYPVVVLAVVGAYALVYA